MIARLRFHVHLIQLTLVDKDVRRVTSSSVNEPSFAICAIYYKWKYYYLPSGISIKIVRSVDAPVYFGGRRG
jgi:hypothetical protein